MSFFSRETASTQKSINGRLVDDEMADIMFNGDKIELNARQGNQIVHKILSPTQHTIFSKPVSRIPLASRLLAEHGIKIRPDRAKYTHTSTLGRSKGRRTKGRRSRSTKAKTKNKKKFNKR